MRFFQKPIDKFANQVYNTSHKNHEGGVALTANKFVYCFYYFAKGCPSFVSSEN